MFGHYVLFARAARKYAEQGAHRLNLLNLLDRFSLREAEALLMGKMHMNAAGYGYLARFIADGIVGKGLLP
jgi:hypothetical protein